ncbi:helix-turn-helix transcriptional regulator [Polaribacter atrinae]|uniref:helix-turn-helix transcriptional regulator n=1 Tax=Polaribacter atrinae TaxID=1333662 RepID=UPI0030FA5323
MKNIPNISFKSNANSKDFEFINLSHLFTRIFTDLDHNPELPHRISFFALLIVTNGNGKHQIDLKDYNLSAGSVLKIAKGQVHAFQKNPKHEGFLIIFTENFVLNYFSKSSINLISHLYNYHTKSPIANDKEGNDIFLNQLVDEPTTENSFAKKNIIASLLNIYLLKLEGKSNTSELKKHKLKQYDTFINFKNLVESDYTKTRNVKDYANKLLISTKHLNQTVRDFTLNTAKSFIDAYVILEAKRAIVSTEKSLKEIAFELGFDEVTNFTKFFKNKMGISPKIFRKNQLT